MNFKKLALSCIVLTAITSEILPLRGRWASFAVGRASGRAAAERDYAYSARDTLSDEEVSTRKPSKKTKNSKKNAARKTSIDPVENLA